MKKFLKKILKKFRKSHLVYSGPYTTWSEAVKNSTGYDSKIIIENSISYSIQNIFPKKIDEVNILNASIMAMHKCIDNLIVKPEFLIVDGNRFKSFGDIPYETIVKGDAKYLSIASASILAKHSRDNYMKKISKEFPKYFWLKNKGYPTKQHKDAIKKYGTTIHHRKSFRLYDEQLTIDF